VNWNGKHYAAVADFEASGVELQVDMILIKDFTVEVKVLTVGYRAFG
jgi:hypothetical protein